MDTGEIVYKCIGTEPYLFYGFADLTGKMPPGFNSFRYAVVIGRILDSEIIDSITDGPNIIYWNHYREVNTLLSRYLTMISDSLRAQGIPTRIISPTLTDDEIDTRYKDTLRAEFSHKMAATQAGLGWIGKTALFVSERYGPRVRLATLLTPVPLNSLNPPVTESRCGKCTICVDKCPAHAATGELWHTGLDRDEFFDAFKCRAMCRVLGNKMVGKNKRLCGICVAVCPVER